jgi:CubicO group peptidase (beta-lactamase class C family)
MKHVRFASVAIAGLFFFILSPILNAQDLPLDILERDIRKALVDFQVPGLAIGIVKDGRTVLLKGYGVKDIERPDAVDENTVFGLGSASKTFTAGLAAALVHEGRLRWDDRIVTHLPEFRLYDPWLTNEARLSDLLSHRVGVADLGLLFLGTTRGRDDVVGKVGFLPAQIGFRTGWAYNNILFIAAGQLMSRITGKSWDDSLREKIFDPLGMTASGSRFRDVGSIQNRVTPHWYENGRPVPIPWGDMDTAGPAGSVYSNAVDLVKWMRLHLDGGSLNGRTIWSPEIQKTLFSPHSLLPDIPLGWPASLSAYALGWFVTDYRGRAVVWHGGNCDGMSSVIGLCPENKLGIAILQNTFPTRFEYDLMLRIMDMFAGLPEKEWRVLGKPQPMSLALNKFTPGPDVKTPAASLVRSLEGRYVSELYGIAEVRSEGNRMMLRIRDYPAAVLHAKGGLDFVADFGDGVHGMFGLILGGQTYTPARFVAGPDGRATELIVDGFGPFKISAAGEGA